MTGANGAPGSPAAPLWVVFFTLTGLPLLTAFAAAAILTWTSYDYARTEAKQQLLGTVRALANTVDGEFLRYEALLRALSTSPSFAARDWRALDRQARAALTERDAWIVVANRDDLQLVNTRLPSGATLSAFPREKSVWDVLDSGRSHVCGLRGGPVEPNTFCLDVPVREGGRAAYRLTIVLRARAMARMTARQLIPAGAYASVADSTGTIVWRNVGADRFVGRPVTTGARLAMTRADSDLIESWSLEGTSTYLAFAHAQKSGWKVLIGIPRELFDIGIARALQVGVSLAAALLLLSVGASFWWSRRFGRDLRALEEAAHAIGQGDSIGGPASKTLEIGRLATALRQADSALSQRRANVEEEHARLEARVADAVAAREAALAELHETRRLETLGQLTGKLAHDFNNLLTPVMGSLDLLRRRADDTRSLRLIDAALAGVEGARLLLARLLAFGRRQLLNPVPVDVEEFLTGIHEPLESSLGAHVRVEITPPSRPVALLADPAQLKMAVLDLAANAGEAMEGGGTLQIVAESVTHAGGDGLEPGDYVQISLVDTGAGMAPDQLRRATEPFFTTKARSRGAGLGLPMVQGMATQSGGALRLSSTPGRGTRADLWLPASDRAPENRSGKDANASKGASGESRILLAEDEDAVRQGIAGMLEELGYAVDTVPSGEAARAALDRKQYAALISDHLMGGLTGAELIRGARDQDPALVTVLISGFTGPLVQLPSGTLRLNKPIRLHELEAVLSSALGKA